MQALGKLVKAAADLAAKVLPHMMLGLVGGGWDVEDYEVKAVGRLLKAAPGLVPQTLEHVVYAIGVKEQGAGL